MNKSKAYKIAKALRDKGYVAHAEMEPEDDLGFDVPIEWGVRITHTKSEEFFDSVIILNHVMGTTFPDRPRY